MTPLCMASPFFLVTAAAIARDVDESMRIGFIVAAAAGAVQRALAPLAGIAVPGPSLPPIDGGARSMASAHRPA